MTRTSAAAETAVDWRYGPCPETSPPPNPDNCGFPPGAVNVAPTTHHSEVTCASLGVGSTSTVVDPNNTPNDPTLITGKTFDLSRRNKVILWSPEGWFWASSTPLDAVIVHFAGDNGPASAGEKLSIAYRYMPAAYASEWIAGYGTQNDENGVPYRTTALEFCYTLSDSTNNGSGDDGGTGVTTEDAGTERDAGGGTKTW